MTLQNEKKKTRVDAHKALQIIQLGGVLSQSIKSFEAREAQQQMMANILEAYEKSSIALIEAGTGTGKSVAYLIPAMLWAVQTKERTLISTHTITLQEQLVNKDIPLLLNALKLDLKVVLVKGMNNYLCLRKLEETRQILPVYAPEERDEIEKIEAWKSTTRDGTRSDLSFTPSHSVWEKVGAESDTCNHQECPHYANCYFMRARKEASEAHLLVANHHLLCTDLSVRAETNNYKDPAVLPLYKHIVLDEAHHIEDVATEHFASEASYIGLLRLLARLASDKQGKTHGKLPFLKTLIEQHFQKAPPTNVSKILRKLSIDFPGLRTDVTVYVEKAFHVYTEFLRIVGAGARESEDGPTEENKVRLRSYHRSHPMWESEIVPATKQLIAALQRYNDSLVGLEADFISLNEPTFEEKSKGVRFDLAALGNRLNDVANVLTNFILNKEENTSVRWIEKSSGALQNTYLLHAELDMAQKLSQLLFSKFSTIILCSATLATDGKFDFIQNRLGINAKHLPDREILTRIYESPFDYRQQALFVVPTDIPNPADTHFNSKAVEAIWQAIQASRGNAFVLFTSYSMMKACYSKMESSLRENRFVGLKQGDGSRQALLNTFKKTDRSVLFGTDSFWEGVDVVGDALRCVIIVKLPFKVPSEPIIQARSEAISAKGGDPFMEYTLPQAIVKFKQGFGRLIRNRRDRGCVVCLDTRLVKKGYGKQFLNSLPECQYVFSGLDGLKKNMEEFYRKTHHLVNDKL